MARNDEAPVITRTDGHPTSETEETHPAYAQIAVSRVSGGSGILYGSDFAHHHHLEISIRPSRRVRGLSNDFYFANLDGYITVALSEAQWATFVSTPNSGMGTPCTLRDIRHLGEDHSRQVPGITPPPRRDEQFRREAEAKMREALDRLGRLADAVAALSLSAKARATLARDISMTRSSLTDSLPWVARQFDEHVETTIENAKTEIHAYIAARVGPGGGQGALSGGILDIKALAPHQAPEPGEGGE